MKRTEQGVINRTGALMRSITAFSMAGGEWAVEPLALALMLWGLDQHRAGQSERMADTGVMLLEQEGRGQHNF